MIGFQVGDQRGIIKLLLSIDLSVLLSDPCRDIHEATIRVYENIKDSSAPLHELGSIRCKSGLSTIRKINAGVLAPIIA